MVWIVYADIGEFITSVTLLQSKNESESVIFIRVVP